MGGVIQKQSIHATIYSYLGVVLGFFGNALIMPKVFSTDEIGLLRVIIAVSGVFAGIFSLGIGQLVFRTYHDYVNNEKKINKYFSLFLLLTCLGAILSFPFYWLFIDYFLQENNTTFELNSVLYATIYILIVSKIFYTYFEILIRMKLNIILVNFLQNIVIKGFPVLFLLLFYFEAISYTNYVYIYIGMFILLPFILFLFLYRNNKIRFVKPLKIDKSNRKNFFSLSIFGLLNTVAASLFLYLDTLMINEYLTKSEVGVYSVLFLFGFVVGIPSRILKSITGVLIVKNVKQNKWREVIYLNTKGSRFLIVFSVLIFLLVYCNAYTVLGYMDSKYSIGGLVILFIGLSQLIEALFGFNSEIISASKYYWIHLPFTILMIIIGIITNIVMIPIYGVNGAAMATFLSLFFIYAIRYFFVLYLFKVNSLDIKVILNLIILIVIIGFNYLIPNLDNIYINLIVRCAVITLVYVPVVYKLKISKDFNRIINKNLIDKIKR